MALSALDMMIAAQAVAAGAVLATAGPIGNALGAIIFDEPYVMPTKVSSDVNLSVFDRYLGEYNVEENGVIRITRVGAEFRIQLLDAPGQPVFVATPISNTEVRVDDLGVAIQFTAEADLSKVSILVHAPGKDPRKGYRVSAVQQPN